MCRPSFFAAAVTLVQEEPKRGGASGVPRFTEERAKLCQESAMLGRTGAAKLRRYNPWEIT
jgi:hypothetical protein